MAAVLAFFWVAAARLAHVAAVEDTAVGVSSKANEIAQVTEPWRASTVVDLFGEYSRVFPHGNRNAASHLWARFLLERSEQMPHEKLSYMFSGFCAVSGSPVRPSDYNRYRVTLERADGSGKVAGFFHHCCWPCLCDAQDFIKVDTRTVRTASGERSYNFAVIGNPCANEAELRRPFQDSFGHGMETLAEVAPEVRCQDGELVGAPLSDGGHVIIGMVFGAPEGLAPALGGAPQPGRVSEAGGVRFQDEAEFATMCEERRSGGYNSGMGKIFRKVASISPIQAPGTFLQ